MDILQLWMLSLNDDEPWFYSVCSMFGDCPDDIGLVYAPNYYYTHRIGTVNDNILSLVPIIGWAVDVTAILELNSRSVRFGRQAQPFKYFKEVGFQCLTNWLEIPSDGLPDRTVFCPAPGVVDSISTVYETYVVVVCQNGLQQIIRNVDPSDEVKDILNSSESNEIAIGTPLGNMEVITEGNRDEYEMCYEIPMCIIPLEEIFNIVISTHHCAYSVQIPQFDGSLIYIDPFDYIGMASLDEISWGEAEPEDHYLSSKPKDGLPLLNIEQYFKYMIWDSAERYIEKGYSIENEGLLIFDKYTFLNTILQSEGWKTYWIPGCYEPISDAHGTIDYIHNGNNYDTRWDWELLNSQPVVHGVLDLGIWHHSIFDFNRWYGEPGSRMFTTEQLTALITDEDIIYRSEDYDNPPFIIAHTEEFPIRITHGEGSMSVIDPDYDEDIPEYIPDPDGDEKWIFTPDEGWTGAVELQYVVKDSTQPYAKYLDGYCHPDYDNETPTDDMYAYATFTLEKDVTPEDMQRAIECFRSAIAHFIDSINYYHKIDPLALDLDGNGLDSIVLDDSDAFFDLDQDGFREHVQWLGSGDGFLALDVNGNGVIDDISELFGDATQQNGFLQLAALDDNSDGLISADDAAFAQLLVWRDLNGDGISDDGELASLADTGIASINLPVSGTVSSFTWADSTTGAVEDLFLDYNDMIAWWGGDAEIDPAFEGLPELRGYGVVKDLALAATENTDLMALVQELALVEDAETLYVSMDDFLAAWTGADVIPADELRGQYNSRKLAIIEAFMGHPFTMSILGEEVNEVYGEAFADLDQGYEILKNHFYADFALQSVFAEEFSEAIWGKYMDRFYYFMDDEDVPAYWASIVKQADAADLPYLGIILSSMGIDTGIELSDLAPLLDPGVLDAMTFDPVQYGTDGADTLTIAPDKETLDGLYGNDILRAGLTISSCT